ncbi:hypothetical protein MRX96_043996 [Rhipicephalus microplus]
MEKQSADKAGGNSPARWNIQRLRQDNFTTGFKRASRYEKERGRRGSRLGRWVPDPSLVTVEPGLPATFYLPRPCVADVLRLQGILCLRTRGAVGLRARVPAEVSGRDAAGGSAWSTAPTGPPGLPCEQRGAVGLRARAPADVSSRDVAAGAEPTHQLVAWLTVRTTQASSRRSNEPRLRGVAGTPGVLDLDGRETERQRVSSTPPACLVSEARSQIVSTRASMSKLAGEAPAAIWPTENAARFSGDERDRSSSPRSKSAGDSVAPSTRWYTSSGPDYYHAFLSLPPSFWDSPSPTGAHPPHSRRCRSCPRILRCAHPSRPLLPFFGTLCWPHRRPGVSLANRPGP